MTCLRTPSGENSEEWIVARRYLSPDSRAKAGMAAVGDTWDTAVLSGTRARPGLQEAGRGETT